MEAILNTNNLTDITKQQETKGYSGYLINCGKCRNPILYPHGLKRIQCPLCSGLNILNPQSVCSYVPKSIIVCPKCNTGIVYSIGCTHLMCSCGTYVTIEEPDYYIPCYKH